MCEVRKDCVSAVLACYNVPFSYALETPSFPLLQTETYHFWFSPFWERFEEAWDSTYPRSHHLLRS